MKVTGKNSRQLLDRSLSWHSNPCKEEIQSVVDRVWQTLANYKPALEGDVQPARRRVPTSKVWQLAPVAVAVVLAALSVVAVRSFVWKNDAQAFVETDGNGLQRIVGGKYEDVLSDGHIAFGEIIRSREGSGPSLVLNDGSRIEMRSKSELVLEPANDGVRIQLHTGSVIVSAAKQRTGHLYVRTKDLTASVVGTVFVVKAEEGGSRVSVIQGEVRVEQGATRRELLPGEQVATNPLMEPLPVGREVSWSRHAEMHLAQLQQAVTPAAAAPTAPKFEVASIRVEVRGGAESGLSPQCHGVDGLLEMRNPGRASMRDLNPNFQPAPPAAPQGRCVARASLWHIIDLAYGPDVLVASDLGGPQWANPGGLQFQIDAKAQDPATATKLQLQQMLQALLTDRFKLKLAWQTREFQGSVMYAEKGVVKLPEASSEEALTLVTHRVGETEQRVITGRASMKEFLDFISLRSPLLGPPGWKDGVLDRTDLKGRYAFNLAYTVPPIATVGGEGGRRGGGDGIGGRSPAFSNMRDALQEQLGLRLESAKIPTEIPVIESVEMPSDN